MPSAIDPTKPAAGTNASKADQRANWQAAKDEIEALQARQTPDPGGQAAEQIVETDGAGGYRLAAKPGGGGGATTFLALTDTPSGYTGEAGKFAAVKAGEDGLEFLAGSPQSATAATTNYTPAPGSATRTVKAALDDYAVNVKHFGAVGDGATPDHVAFQAAIDTGHPLYVPPGVYVLGATLTYPAGGRLVMRGSTGGSSPATGNDPAQTPGQAIITGDIVGPLIRRADVWVDHTDTLQGSASGGVGAGLVLEDISFSNKHEQGCCVQVMNSAQIHISRCAFYFRFRGVLLLQAFDALVSACSFTGDWFAVHDVSEENFDAAIGLMIPGHTTVVGCGFKGCGTAVHAYGPEANLLGCRVEVCGYGLRAGGVSLSPDQFGQNMPMARSVISGVSMESNYRHVLLSRFEGGSEIANLGLQGGTNGPGPGGKSEYGIRIESGNETTALRNVNIGGHFLQAAVVFAGGAPRLEGLSAGQDEPDRPIFSGSSAPFGQQGATAPRYHATRVPLNPGVNAAQPVDLRTATAFSDLQLRGLKGLNIRDPNVLPNNLGGIKAVAEGASSVGVSFPGLLTAASTAFNGEPAVNGGAGSALGAGTYYYASTAIEPRGETGVNLTTTAGNNNYKQATINAGDSVTLNFFGLGSHDQIAKRRIYRGTALGRFEGFFEIAGTQNTFTDTGGAFTGKDAPPPADFIAIPSAEEPDADYAVVVTPSWGTTAWVTGKATTGFTINFGTAAPTGGGTVQWLLFRP